MPSPMNASAEPPPPTAKLPWPLAWRLALGQIVAWGILYYAFTVVVGPMQAGTGWSRTFLNSGLSLGLLAWGVCALPVGAWIQRRGGRGLMAGASALGGVALMLMGVASQRVAYLLAWLMLGMAMAGLLYDSAFAVITRAFGAQYRRGITLITLVGGLASTVFIPVAQLAVDQLGWRQALIALGGFQIAFGVPLHLFGIPRFVREASSLPRHSAAERWRGWWAEFRRDVSDPRFVGLAVWFTAYSAAFTGLIFQLIPVLQAMRVENATIVQAIAFFGPMQVLGRFVLTTRANHFSTLRVGRWALGALIAALLILLLAPTTLAWLILYAAIAGVGNGVLTILRGTAIAELFGPDRYAELNGALSAPGVLAKSVAPLALAALWSATGEPRLVFAGVLALVLVAVGGLWLATRAQRLHAPTVEVRMLTPEAARQG
jgi:MFS family permease